MENVATKVSENVCLKIIKKDSSGLFWLLQDKIGKLTNCYVFWVAFNNDVHVPTIISNVAKIFVALAKCEVCFFDRNL